MFVYIQVKVSRRINVKLKITFNSQNYKSQLQVRIHSRGKNNSTWDHLMLICIHGSVCDCVFGCSYKLKLLNFHSEFTLGHEKMYLTATPNKNFSVCLFWRWLECKRTLTTRLHFVAVKFSRRNAIVPCRNWFWLNSFYNIDFS